MPAPRKPGLLKIQILTTPSPTDPPEADRFYWALGVATIALGRLEGHFVSCLMNIIQIAKDKRIGQKLPMKWEKREEMWRDAFRRIPSLKPLEKDAIAFLNDLDGLSKDRNLLLHCLWESFRPEGATLAMNILNIKATSGTPDGVGILRDSVNIEQLAQITLKANDLTMKLLPIS